MTKSDVCFGRRRINYSAAALVIICLIWQEACRYAAHRTEADCSAYYKLSIDRLLELVAAESLREVAASFGWRPWVRAQNRLWGAAFQVIEGASLIANRSWRVLNLSARV